MGENLRSRWEWFLMNIKKLMFLKAMSKSASAPVYKFKSLSAYNDTRVYSSNNYYRVSVFASPDMAADYGISDSNDTGLNYPIMIPSGATKVKVSIDPSQKTLLYNSTCCVVYFMKNVSCEVTSYTDCALYVGKDESNIRSLETKTIDVPEGADCFAIVIRFTNQYTSEDDPATLISTLGLTIEYE